MAEYRGLIQIGKRMGWKKAVTIMRRVRNEGFPIYKDISGRIRRPVYKTNDDLIHLWELGKCKATAEELRQTGKYQYRQKKKRNPAAIAWAERNRAEVKVNGEEPGSKRMVAAAGKKAALHDR